ncbi:AAA family ATPase [Methanocaldococcus sp.]|uniref:AAA family ATPase n=1 Tax=Methanocaldococcus sp. TaxID=2152917 RepID=UPI0026249619|nr:AAA family ATPase [Methanocaldococcus sp.]MCQ6253845.1 AAA family ATPase [Methanocaldococcus sp.]
MKIKAIEVNSLFSYDKFKIEFNEGNIAVIVGPNNAGKSNLFRVLKFLKDVINDETKEIKSVKDINKKTIAEEVQNYLHNKSRRFAKIVVDIEFDDFEKEMLKDYFKCFFKSNYLQFKKICDELGFDIEDKLVKLFSKGKFIWEYNGEPSGRVVPYYQIPIKMLINEKLKEEFNKLSIFNPEILKSNEKELHKFCSFIFDINDVSKEDIKKFSKDNQHYLIDLNSIIHHLSKKLNDDIYFNMDKRNGYLLYNSQNEPIFEVKVWGSWDTQVGGIYNFLKKYPLKAKDTIFLTLLLVGLYCLKDGNLSYDKILKHCKDNPSDNRLFEKAKNIFKYVDRQFDNNNLLFHHFILKLFDKATVKFKEVRSYPKKYKISSINELENKNYEGNGNDLAKYLFYLKNAHEINIINKYNRIRNSFKDIFKTEKIDFDVVISHDGNRDGHLEVVITFEDKQLQLPIDRVGSGIFEVLNILAVVIGAEYKVILLDEPALHLHPVYQKRLLEEFKKLNENGNNQIIIITHSPYFVDSKLLELENTFRFYKENGKTKAINVGKLTKNKTPKDFIKNDGLIRSLFANGVILVEGDLEYISIPILLKKANCVLEDYNIEIINVGSKKGFKKYVKLMNALRIPCAIICDGDTAYNLYNKNNKKWTLSDENLPYIVEVYGNIKPFWIKDIETILNNIEKKIKMKKSALKTEINIDKPLEKELAKYGIEPIYNEIKDDLKNKLLIFACKEYDWSGFLGSNDKDIENCMKKTYEFNDKEKLNELKQFIKNFNKCINNL